MVSEPTIDTVPSCGQENDYRRASPNASDDLADKLERLCCAETEGKFFDCVTDNIQTIIRSLRQLAAAELSCDELRRQRDDADSRIAGWKQRTEAAESHLRSTSKALEEIAAIEDQEFGGDWDEIEQAREIANKALRSQPEGGRATDDQSERIRRTDEMLKNTSS